MDECISPSLSRFLNAGGLHDAIHPRDRGRLRDPDHVVFARAIAEDRIVVTENAEDFRKLAGSVDSSRLDRPAVRRTIRGPTAHGDCAPSPRQHGRRSTARFARELRSDDFGEGFHQHQPIALTMFRSTPVLDRENTLRPTPIKNSPNRRPDLMPDILELVTQWNGSGATD